MKPWFSRPVVGSWLFLSCYCCASNPFLLAAGAASGQITSRKNSREMAFGPQSHCDRCGTERRGFEQRAVSLDENASAAYVGAIAAEDVRCATNPVRLVRFWPIFGTGKAISSWTEVHKRDVNVAGQIFGPLGVCATIAVCTLYITKCPLWVKSGHAQRTSQCPLCPQ